MKGRDEFEGQEVVQVACQVGGSIGDGRLNELLHPGDRAVIVAEVFIRRIEHHAAEEGLVRRQVMRVAEGFVIEGVDADELVLKLRADRKRQLDELLGTPPIEGFEEDA